MSLLTTVLISSYPNQSRKKWRKGDRKVEKEGLAGSSEEEVGKTEEYHFLPPFSGA